MELRDLFGDGSADGDFRRVGCLHEVLADGSCPKCPSRSGANCWQMRPERKSVRIPPDCTSLPRSDIRAILQAGDEICLEFETIASPSDEILRAVSNILRKLRNTGIQIVVSGLSTADKSKLSRLEWEHA